MRSSGLFTGNEREKEANLPLEWGFFTLNLKPQGTWKILNLLQIYVIHGIYSP
jgi:hypothetical protein